MYGLPRVLLGAIALTSFAAPLCAQVAGSTTSLSVSPASSSEASVVTLSATVTVNGQAATRGSVTFLDGAKALGTVQVVVSGSSAGTAVLRTNSFAVGNHILSASYSGAPKGSQNAGASTSGAVSLTVQQSGLIPSLTTLAVSQESTGLYDFASTVTVIGSAPPTGRVGFSDQTSGVFFGSAPLTSGVSATFPPVSQTAYATGGSPASTAVADFNQDGILDLAVANGDGTVSILLGDPTHPGQFLPQVTYPSGPSSTSIVTADFNGDGILDFATANGDGTVTILLGDPNSPGTFLPPTSYDTGSGGSLVVADFNLDGLPDIAIVGTSTVVLLNNSNVPGVFTAQPATYPMGYASAAVADFNGDGYPDLAVNNAYTATVFFGDPTHPGQFLPQSPPHTCVANCGISPSDTPYVVVGDFNGDGIPDLAITFDSRMGEFAYDDWILQVVVFLGDPVNRGEFLSPTTYSLFSFTTASSGAGTGTTGLVTADFNGDGVPDLAAVGYTYGFSSGGVLPYQGSSVRVLLGDPSHPGQFLPSVAYPSSTSLHPTGPGKGDFAGNGLPDLVFANGDQQSVQVLLNSSSATATLTGSLVTGNGSQSLVANYSGDSNYQLGASSPLSIPALLATTTTLSTSAFVTNSGENVTFTATVSVGPGSYPSSGTVTFYDGSISIASASLTAQGTASYKTNMLAVGPHAISAAYAFNGIWLASTSATLAITVMQSGSMQTSDGGLLFVPVMPCRVMDTRGNGFSGAFGSPSLTPAERDVPILQSACGIPSDAMAYSLNVTAVPQGPLGYLSVWPTGLIQPPISTLNSSDGRVVANAAIVPAGANGSIALYASNTTDAVIDINGYFTQNITPGALAFYPVTPCRVADTRGNGFAGAFGQPSMSAGSDRAFPVLQSSCQIPASAQAYSLNVTVLPSNALPLYYVSAWPSGQAQPFVSTLNSWTGDVVANAAIVPAGADGAIDLFASNDTDVVIDIDGYFAPPGAAGALEFYPVTPCRLVDTRGDGFSGPFGPPSMIAGASRDFPLASSACSIPATVQAYSLNVTVIPPAPLGYLTLWPTGGTPPYVSTLNSYRGEVVANAALVPAGTNGSVTVFATDPTDLVIDVNGVFAP